MRITPNLLHAQPWQWRWQDRRWRARIDHLNAESHIRDIASYRKQVLAGACARPQPVLPLTFTPSDEWPREPALIAVLRNRIPAAEA